MKLIIYVTILFMFESSICFAPPKLSYSLPVDKYGYTSVHNAALNNDSSTIYAIYQTLPEEINRPSQCHHSQHISFKDTPAHLAIFHGKWDAFTMLIACNANLQCQNHEGKKPKDNLLCSEQRSYLKALKDGQDLRRSWHTQQTISQQTQTDQITTAIQTQTDPSSQTTTHAHVQTDPMKPHQEITVKYFDSCPPPIDSVISKLPPPYNVAIQHLSQNSIQKKAAASAGTASAPTTPSARFSDETPECSNRLLQLVDALKEH